ncbi:thiopeptide-type bacteriocin biosynthesis protein [Streptomyces griseocarneus]|uniref:thiopeptide-type bacteriocin biosynthesis protein n=1 Tax=Streptomyces griseocarneus TaxID=51201 RepID=UPI00167C5686|nr:thiopeptide-type bacteriocin biosynthesis protein [Streptomyces griseocarneus]MBZ6476803.1 thiopeptide-type bacteriocin biosynthesis protein [Streptomyces griseocarneus]GHG81350.1 lantibiotic biosynthesis protein [Streptomyces griseocarneus]
MNCTQTSSERTGTAQWRPVHIHIPPSLHTSFLCDVVGPLLKDEGLQDHFFFLRYWQGGPHVRLRMLCGPEARPAEAAERVVEGLARAMPEFDAEAREEYAVGLRLQDELARLEGETSREGQPLGALAPVVYEPEFRKYGGTEGVAIAETVFRKSSVAVLDLLARQPAAAGAGRAPVGEAAKIMVMFLHGAGLGPEAATRFLREYEDYWRKYAPENVQRAWPKMYEGVSSQLTNLCAAVWRGEGTDDVFHRMSVEATARARAVCGAEPDADVHELRLDGTPYLSCVSNYVHTTNNRLGLIPAGEGLVAYLVRRGLEGLVG